MSVSVCEKASLGCVGWGGMGRDLQRLMVYQPNQSHTLTHYNPLTPSPPSPTIHPFTQPSPLPLCLCSWRARRSVPAVVLDHVGQLDDELALFILLTALKGMFLERGVGGGVVGAAKDRTGRLTFSFTLCSKTKPVTRLEHWSTPECSGYKKSTHPCSRVGFLSFKTM